MEHVVPPSDAGVEFNLLHLADARDGLCEPSVRLLEFGKFGFRRSLASQLTRKSLQLGAQFISFLQLRPGNHSNCGAPIGGNDH